MTNLPLESIPSVLLDFMNDDHREATLLTNKLHAQLQELIANPEADRQPATDTLIALYNHDKEHFAREEAEMERTGFPAYGCHKGEHDRVLAEMEEILNGWQAGMVPEQLEQYLNGTAAPWLINHISTMDTVTAMFVSQQ